MAARVRVLVAHAPGSRSPVPALVYNAEVIDDAEVHGALWLCAHNHPSPVSAHQCGVDWIGRATRAILSEAPGRAQPA